MLLASLALSCGGSDNSPRSTATPSATAPNSVESLFSLTEGGRLLVLCGPDNTSTDIYEVTRAGLLRQTESPSGEPVYSFSAAGNRIAFVYPDQSAQPTVAVRDLDDRDKAARGTLVGYGDIAAISTDGTVAWTQRTSRRGKLVTQVRIKREGQPAVRATTYPEIWDLSYSTGRLDAQVASASGKRFKWIRAADRPWPAGRSQKLAMHVPGRIVSSVNGKLAYETARDPNNTLYISDEQGRTTRKTRSAWSPYAWSPDERQLLVARNNPKAPLGLMDVATGAVRSIGPLPCGWVASAQWLKQAPR
ncbi:hypothetical protein [Solirubrobacter pauli]|uniref:hypothetical protein n=1 Tax=Solirubrobacter pauli TaxID=166793 RepID=UPI0011C45F8A|nr:hypothetical protein [Solirubrobacter pauli]